MSICFSARSSASDSANGEHDQRVDAASRFGFVKLAAHRPSRE
jgi:hypothetical protein